MTTTFGPAYNEQLDGARILSQMDRIRIFMLAQEGWLTLAEIAQETGDPEASVSAQLRHLRKPRFGNHSVRKRRRTSGLETYGTWEYQVRFI